MSYVWVDDEEEQRKKNRQILKKMCITALTAAMKSSLEIDISFKNRSCSKDDVSLDIYIMDKGKCLSIGLYDFWGIKKNEFIISAVLKMLKTNKLDLDFKEDNYDRK